LGGDIKGCFYNISREWMLKNILMDKKILKQFIKTRYVFSKELFPTEKGTPQGGVISPTLANMVLNGMEKAVSDACVTAKNIRYADDFVVVCKRREDIDKCRSVIDGFMMEGGVETLS